MAPETLPSQAVIAFPAQLYVTHFPFVQSLLPAQICASARPPPAGHVGPGLQVRLAVLCPVASRQQMLPVAQSEVPKQLTTDVAEAEVHVFSASQV
jgi:hypothetical protein